jgi:hypothetical protein
MRMVSRRYDWNLFQTGGQLCSAFHAYLIARITVQASEPFFLLHVLAAAIRERFPMGRHL